MALGCTKNCYSSVTISYFYAFDCIEILEEDSFE